MLSFILTLSILLIPTFAHCPLCTVATGTAIAVTRYYGIDDLAVGTFIGGFILSTSLWFDRILKKRNKGEFIQMQGLFLTLLGLFFTILSYLWLNLSGPLASSLFGINKLFLGTIVGTLVTFSAFELHKIIRKNMQKSLIPFQGIVFTLISLVLINAGFYLVGWL